MRNGVERYEASSWRLSVMATVYIYLYTYTPKQLLGYIPTSSHGHCSYLLGVDQRVNFPFGEDC